MIGVLDLCAVHCNKTLQYQKLPECAREMQQYGSLVRKQPNIVYDVACDVAYDIVEITYDMQSRTYDIAYDEHCTTS